jgi:S-DNA-T family DNA segregation ATPase FtsK/SpoIIIE
MNTLLEKKIDLFKRLNRTHTRRNVIYRAPSMGCLQSYPCLMSETGMEPAILQDKLHDFDLEGQVINVRQGPVISRYEVRLARGVKLSRVRSVQEDLGIALMSEHIRILAPIPGTNLVGFEVPNKVLATIGLGQVLTKSQALSNSLPIALGVDTVGDPKIFDLAKMPHLLIAGQTGSGKSICLNTIILSLLFTKTPDEVKLILVDPKRVEMTAYKDIPHLFRPIIMESAEATEAFKGLVDEMEKRYQLLAGAKVRNIESYNSSELRMPYIVVAVDEMADLMMASGPELEKAIVRLAQLSRAVGIHLVLATQKPIVKVITGLIKANMPSRIAFKVASKMDSRVILDCNGAESLIGHGDMLMIYPGAQEPERFQGAYVSDEEINSIIESMKG